MKRNLAAKHYYLLLFLAVIGTAISFVYMYHNLDAFQHKPFSNSPILSAPVFYKVTAKGNQYYIDQGNSRIVKVNEQG